MPTCLDADLDNAHQLAFNFVTGIDCNPPVHESAPRNARNASMAVVSETPFMEVEIDALTMSAIVQMQLEEGEEMASKRKTSNAKALYRMRSSHCKCIWTI